ncbi:ImmA/IrrE family metallo-endopeptidase [Methylosinus sp. Ce-a6]|uniref:ImmA/IrrE family metallo-endopeptidase n=1 Tax=Methylosinus sp. Ce-a6 TaxID=2172005 RepID=UPI00135C4300|nr:ImmA/IrrE family metallo-endopeptidase [Methylosinus sp. Ce-a6]
MSHPSDYKVSATTAKQLAADAEELRKLLDADQRTEFNPLDAIRLFEKREVPKKGLLRVLLFDAPKGSKPARVKYKPLRLFVDGDVLEAARVGYPPERFIIAHELGHIVEHDDTAKAFSASDSERLKAWPKEELAEWQADTFADNLLVPRKFLFSFRLDVGAIASACNVERQVVQRQIDALKSERRYVCEECLECGCFTLTRKGTCLQCDVCGRVTEYT